MKSNSVFVTLGLLAAWSLCDVEPVQAQTVINPIFEDGLTGWSSITPVPPILDTAGLPTTLFPSGMYSAALEQADGGSNIRQIVPWIAPAGEVLQESFWYMMPNSEDVTGKEFEAWLSPTSTGPYYADVVYPNAEPDWTYETLTMTTTSPVTSVTLNFDTQDGGGGDDTSAFANVDDITLTDITPGFSGAPDVPEPTAVPLAVVVGIGMVIALRRTGRRKKSQLQAVPGTPKSGAITSLEGFSSQA